VFDAASFAFDFEADFEAERAAEEVDSLCGVDVEDGGGDAGPAFEGVTSSSGKGAG
jgi:hypothetical protein